MTNGKKENAKKEQKHIDLKPQFKNSTINNANIFDLKN